MPLEGRPVKIGEPFGRGLVQLLWVIQKFFWISSRSPLTLDDERIEFGPQVERELISLVFYSAEFNDVECLTSSQTQ